MARTVREIRLSDVQFKRDFGGLLDIQMSHVRLRTQRVKNQCVETLQQLKAAAGDFADVGTIGDVADAKPEYFEFRSVDQWDGNDRGAQGFEGPVVDAVDFNGWCRARMRLFVVRKRVRKRRSQAVLDALGTVNRNGMSKIELKKSQIIKTEQVVRVLMGIDNGVDDTNLFAQQLLAQVGGRVNEQIALGQTEYGATASPLIPGMVAPADVAIAADRGYADGRSCSQQDHLSRNIGCQRLFFHDFFPSTWTFL